MTVLHQAGEATDNALRGIEEEVNVFAKPDAAKAACPPAQLLVRAFILCTCMHAYLCRYIHAYMLPLKKNHQHVRSNTPALLPSAAPPP